MDKTYARMVVAWRYPDPYEMYNADPANLADDVAALINPEYNYYAIFNASKEFVAFCCFGADAQVAGGAYADPALDVGAGIRPELTGLGYGGAIIQAILKFGARRFNPPAFRVTVAAFNQRALRACKSVGFQVKARFDRPSDQSEFVVLLKKRRLASAKSAADTLQ
jgi:RimJ/RimL family protein N-acetyltransferase